MNELILLSVLGVLSLVAGLLRLRKYFLYVVIAGLLLNIGFCINDWNSNQVIYNMMVMDNFALSFTILGSSIAIFWFILSKAYFAKDESFSDHYALVLFSMTGGLVLVSFTNMVMLFLGIEILSIPLFVLAGSHKTRLRSNEAAFKYFLLGAFASAFLLFGIALLYGATGSFENAGIAKAISGGMNGLAFAGMLLMLGAMAFKVSAAPFHFWAPDVYQGSPSMITAFMATFVKTVAFAGFYRLFKTTFAEADSIYSIVFACIATATLLISNISAAVQSNVKRLLAYSSISHAGFMSITLLCMQKNTSGILLYYTLVYSISSLVAFTVFKIVKTNSNEEEGFEAFKGLLYRNRFLALTIAFSLLSMSGIPPLAGFMAKYLVFTAAVSSGYLWLALVGIIASLIGVFYYFKLILEMFGSAPDAETFEVPLYQKAILAICAIALLIMMLIPGEITSLLLN